MLAGVGSWLGVPPVSLRAGVFPKVAWHVLPVGAVTQSEFGRRPLLPAPLALVVRASEATPQRRAKRGVRIAL